MGTVKYSGPVASFHCPTEATIRSLKVHFSPKQLGSGTPSPENVREIVGWDGVKVYNCSKPYASTTDIPAEYKKVEYLESTGTQFINTQIPISTISSFDTNWKLTFAIAAFGKTQIIAGQDYNAKQIPILNQRVRKDWTGQTSKYFSEIITLNKIYDIKQNGNVFTFCEESETIGNPSTRNGPFALFGKIVGLTDPEQSTLALMKLYGFIAKNSDGLVLNLVPCIRKSDNKPGMYDTVSQTFYTNAGTGEFLYGPEISGYSTDYEFGVLGKNKFDYASTTFIQGIRGNDGDFVSDSVSHYTEQFIPVIPATQYTLSGNNLYSGGYVVRIYYSDANKNWISKTSGDRTNALTFTTPSNCYYIQIQTNSNGTNPDTWQLELGSTATAYEPYDPNKTVYGGWVDLVSGEVAEAYKYKNLSGSSNWFQNGSNIFYQSSINDRKKVSKTNFYCNILPVGVPTTENTAYIQFMSKSTGGLGIITNNSSTTLANIQTLADNNQIIIYYELNTPITYYIAPTQLQTFLGQNNVWSNADYVEVEYDLHETQNILARKQFIIANQPHVETPAVAPLQNFVTDMAAPLRECKVYFNPVQEGSGDPSPDNIRPINGRTGLTIYRGEENLIPANLNWLPKKMKTSSGKISGSVYNCFWFPVPKGTIYFHKRNSAVGIAYMAFIDKEPEIGDVVYGNITLSSYTNYTFDNSEGHPYAIICGPTGTRTETASEYCLQNEICVTAAHFNSLEKYPEPYSGATLSIDWTDEAGTIYGGYVDLATGEIWKTYNKIILDGVTTYYKVNSDYSNSTYIIGGVVYLEPAGIYDTTSNSKLFCDTMPILAVNDIATPLPYIRTISAGNQYLRIYLANTEDYPELDTKQKRIDFVNAYLAENPITVVYPLKVPQLIDTITPTQLKSLRGTNNIWASNNGDNIELSYWKH